MCLCVCLSVCLWLSICVSVCLSLCLSVSLSLCLIDMKSESVCLSVCLSLSLYLSLPVCPSVFDIRSECAGVAGAVEKWVLTFAQLLCGVAGVAGEHAWEEARARWGYQKSPGKEPYDTQKRPTDMHALVPGGRPQGRCSASSPPGEGVKRALQSTPMPLKREPLTSARSALSLTHTHAHARTLARTHAHQPAAADKGGKAKDEVRSRVRLV